MKSARSSLPLRVFLRPSHEHDPREQTQKDFPNPTGHGVSLRRAVMHIEHKHSDHDRQSHKYHGEKQVLSNQRDDERRGRDGFGDDQEEDSEGEENRNTQGHLLSTIGREIKHQDGQKGDEQTGNDHVDSVEERQAADVERVRDVGVDLLAAVVLDVVLVSWSVDDHPLAALPEILQVDGGADEHQVDLGFVVGPRAELHSAVLVVEGEEGDVDLAGALKDGRRDPGDVSVVAKKSFCFVVHLEISNCAEVWKQKRIVKD